MGKSSSSDSLGHKVAKGGAILIVLRLSIRGIGLISTMCLFRILMPSDFGLVALAMVVVGLAEVVAEFGFDQNLLRNKHAVRADYDVAWSLNLLRALVISALLLVIAHPAAAYLNEPRLVSIICWLALVPLIDGFGNIGVVDFSKDFEFGKEYTLKVTQKICSFVATLVCAYIFRNYWALVVGTLTGKIVGLVLGYVLHPYRPRFYLVGARAVFRFSFWIFLNQIVLYAGNQTDKILIQRFYDADKVGIFRVAEEICSMVMEFVWPVEKALFAGFAKLSDDIAKLRQAVLSSMGLVAMIGVPMSILIMLLAEPAVSVLLGDRGRAAVPFVKILVLHGAIRSCFAGAAPTFLVLGRPHVNTMTTFLAVAVRLSVLFAFFPLLGIMAAPWSLVAGSCASFIVVWIQLTKHMDLEWLDFPRALWRTIFASIAMIAVVKCLDQFPLAQRLFQNDWAHLFIALPIAIAAYIGAQLLLWILCGKPQGPESQLIKVAGTMLHRPAT